MALCMRGAIWLSVILFATASPETCDDLDSWLSESVAPGEEGYHVLCAMPSKLVQVYQMGVKTDTPQEILLDSGYLRKSLKELLRIRNSIVYKVPDKKLKWKKQPWTLFTAAGEELRVGTEAETISNLLSEKSAPVTLLLFEGGAWRWPTIRVNYGREVMPGIFLRTVSRQPALFEVKIDDKALGAGDDGLSINLLSDVIDVAKSRMKKSEMEGKVDEQVRSSDQTFLPYHTTPRLRQLGAGTAKLLRGHIDQLEHLQVLRYSRNQHYDAHRDYWDPREFPDVPRFTNREGYWHQRHATLLWYLAAPEKGGETWFPRAHGGNIPYDNWKACDARGAMVSPANATAVLFYSLTADGNIDEFSWHCGCTVEKGTKWAANSWMRINAYDKRPSHRRPVTDREDL